MFKHKKLATKKLTNNHAQTIKIKDTKPIASPLKTHFDLKDLFYHRQVFQVNDDVVSGELVFKKCNENLDRDRVALSKSAKI